ncbi:MAG: DNA polymerase III subunit delta' [Parvibaculales bacterium]
MAVKFEDDDYIDIDGEQSPRLCQTLYGHQKTTRQFMQGFAQNRLHHAWLLTGAKGIGKASFAYHAAKFILSNPNGFKAEHLSDDFSQGFSEEIVQLIERGAHPDLFILNRNYDFKTGKFRNDITIERARELITFLEKTPAMGGWRVCIIDSVDEMSRSSANAILKAVEEPSDKVMMFLVSHRPGKLLPTIKSRCQKVPMASLDMPILENLLADLHPDLEAQSRQATAYLAGGSIGLAIDIIENGGLDIYRDMVDALASLPNTDGVLLHALAGRMADIKSGKRYQIFQNFLIGWLHGLTLTAARGTPAPVLFEGEADTVAKFLQSSHLEHWLDVWEKTTDLFQQADALNLDKKQTILECFTLIRKAVLGRM